MNRRNFIKKSSIATAAGMINFKLSAALKSRPNFLWLTFEDTSAYELGCYGNSYVKTPFIDKLAKKGIQFMNASSNAPQCSPARSTIISGCYATTYCSDRHRSKTNLVPKDKYYFPKLLRKAGYFTSNNLKTDYNVRKDVYEKEEKYIWDATKQTATYNSSKRKKGQPFFSVFNNAATHMSRLTTITTDKRKPYRIKPDSLTLPPHVPDLKHMREDYALHLEGVEDVDKWVNVHLKELKVQGLDKDTIIFMIKT